jgi:hypothetical protein
MFQGVFRALHTVFPGETGGREQTAASLHTRRKEAAWIVITLECPPALVPLAGYVIHMPSGILGAMTFPWPRVSAVSADMSCIKVCPQDFPEI